MQSFAETSQISMIDGCARSRRSRREDPAGNSYDRLTIDDQVNSTNVQKGISKMFLSFGNASSWTDCLRESVDVFSAADRVAEGCASGSRAVWARIRSLFLMLK